MTAPSERLAAISRWIDGSPSYVDCHPETVMWRRVTKVCEEAGEVVDALGGMVGENPRKGVTHTRDDLIGELLDTAISALAAVEHLTGNEGESWGLLCDKIERVCDRAGITEASR